MAHVALLLAQVASLLLLVTGTCPPDTGKYISITRS